MKKNNKKFFIEALEQRIMLDGAGASTFIDTLEDTAHNKFSLNNESKVNKFALDIQLVSSLVEILS